MRNGFYSLPTWAKQFLSTKKDIFLLICGGITYSTELFSILHFGKPTFSDIHLFGKDLNSGEHSNPIVRALSTSLLHSEVEPRGDFWTARGGAVWREAGEEKLLCSHYSFLLEESLAWPASQLSITAQLDHQVGGSPEWRAHSSELPAGKEEIKK